MYLEMDGEWGLLPLAGISTAPLLSSDGSVRAAEGYDHATSLWCANVPTLRIPDHSIRAEAEAAVRQARYGLMLLNASLERRRPMLYRPSDDEVRRQILGVFMRRRIPASGILQRNNFFDVRDGDFQRGINKAVANNSITIDLRNRYRYQLTETGYAVGRMIDPVRCVIGTLS